MNLENEDEVAKVLQDSILYEDDDVLVLNKPIDIAVHGDGKRKEYTVSDWLVSYAPNVQSVGESQFVPNTTIEIQRSGVVHRLDRATSGVLLLVKNQAAHAHCKAQFQDRSVKKVYRAFIYGQMRDRYGTIAKAIGRSAKDWRKRSAEKGAKGTLREAQTDWEVLKTGIYQGERFSHLALKPKTGRMHQLRVHLRSMNRPIVGDELYADMYISTSNNLEFTRLALHAFELEIMLPTGEVKKFTAPEPDSFVVAAKNIAED